MAKQKTNLDYLGICRIPKFHSVDCQVQKRECQGQNVDCQVQTRGLPWKLLLEADSLNDDGSHLEKNFKDHMKIFFIWDKLWLTIIIVIGTHQQLTLLNLGNFK